MNQGGHKISLNIPTVSNWLIILGIAWLLASIGLGWVIKSFLILIGLLVLTPVIGFFVLRWWLNRNLIQGSCPVCQYELTALNQTQFQCPSCGEPLTVDGGVFNRMTPPGTIDVTAIDVSVRQLGD